MNIFIFVFTIDQLILIDLCIFHLFIYIFFINHKHLNLFIIDLLSYLSTLLLKMLFAGLLLL